MHQEKRDKSPVLVQFITDFVSFVTQLHSCFLSKVNLLQILFLWMPGNCNEVLPSNRIQNRHQPTFLQQWHWDRTNVRMYFISLPSNHYKIKINYLAITIPSLVLICLRSFLILEMNITGGYKTCQITNSHFDTNSINFLESQVFRKLSDT